MHSFELSTYNWIEDGWVGLVNLWWIVTWKIYNLIVGELINVTSTLKGIMLGYVVK